MASFAIIAGESSGDLLGARLMQALPVNSQFIGVGGPLMEGAGLKSLFPMSDIALMGFAEILPHIFKLKRRIKETVAAILAANPDCVITIDSPGFCFRIAKQLREQGYGGKLIHYVAPTVWAYKPERAAKTAALFDALMVILPFEPPYFEKEGMDVAYVGHPIPWEWRGETEQPAKNDNTYRIGMLAGSRAGEVKRHLPIFKRTAELLKKEIPNLSILLPVRPHLAEKVRTKTAHWPVPVEIIVGDEGKQAAFKRCDMLLAKSGTVSVECAMAGVPTITTYRANPLSVWLVRKMITINHINLINITANAPIIPELIQEDCTPENLASEILKLKNDPAAQAEQITRSEAVLQTLGKGSGINPAQKAAEFVLSRLAV